MLDTQPDILHVRAVGPENCSGRNSQDYERDIIMENEWQEWTVSDSVEKAIVRAEFRYEPPETPKKSGSVWDEKWDIPGVVLVLKVPGKFIPDFLRDEDTRIMGMYFDANWGEYENDSKSASRVFRGVLADAEIEAREYAEQEVEKIKAIAERRAARLAQREISIKYHHSRVRSVKPPKDDK